MSVLEYIPWLEACAGIPAPPPSSFLYGAVDDYTMSTMPLDCAAAPQVRLLSVNSDLETVLYLDSEPFSHLT